MLGVIFPPSIIASAAVLGAGGAAIGKARELHHRTELADELAGALDPGHSGIIALVSDPSVVEIRKALDKANRVVEHAVDKAVAADIKAAAKEAEAEEKAEEKARRRPTTPDRDHPRKAGPSGPAFVFPAPGCGRLWRDTRLRDGSPHD